MMTSDIGNVEMKGLVSDVAAESTAMRSSGVCMMGRLGAAICDGLGRLRLSTEVALVDFPGHSNCGDSAIWMGEKSALQSRVKVAYVCDLVSYSKPVLEKCLPEGDVLIHGGGNFGDLWPMHQAFRERIISDFPDRRIIQMPQSIQFNSDKSLARARRIINRHENVIILARDGHSAAVARAEFRARVILCPDMAFALGPLERLGQHTCDTLWLRRSDLESGMLQASNRVRMASMGGVTVECMDWLAEPPSATKTSLKFLSGAISWAPNRLAGLWRLNATQSERMARMRLRRGCAMLSRGKVVITDRLHGHILCLLMSIPHVCLGDKYGKLKNFRETWRTESSISLWADTVEEARDMAKGLLASQTGQLRNGMSAKGLTNKNE
ncbi:MAG: polysaccharide pyruvyl transferase family protein [Candidatus Omnitrophota bacterium]|nr:polysaccharide pyruvyl transferase family protein [Candidatus Omnitrophota bacterium]